MLTHYRRQYIWKLNLKYMSEEASLCFFASVNTLIFKSLSHVIIYDFLAKQCVKVIV